MIVVVNGSSANASSEFNIRINSDGGSNYYYQGTRLAGDSTAYLLHNANFSFGTDGIFIGAMSGDGGSSISAGMYIDGGTTTGGKMFTVNGGTNRNGGVTYQVASPAGVYLGSAAITSVSIISSSGNFDSGSIYVYGSAA